MFRSWSKLTWTPIFSRWFRPDHLGIHHKATIRLQVNIRAKCTTAGNCRCPAKWAQADGKPSRTASLFHRWENCTAPRSPTRKVPQQCCIFCLEVVVEGSHSSTWRLQVEWRQLDFQSCEKVWAALIVFKILLHKSLVVRMSNFRQIYDIADK